MGRGGGAVCFPICVTAGYNSVINVQYGVQFISVLKFTLCVTGGWVFTAGTDQIMVSFLVDVPFIVGEYSNTLRCKKPK
jgi:hypothetical protein